MPFHWRRGRANPLTNPALDPILADAGVQGVRRGGAAWTPTTPGGSGSGSSSSATAWPAPGSWRRSSRGDRPPGHRARRGAARAVQPDPALQRAGRAATGRGARRARPDGAGRGVDLRRRRCVESTGSAARSSCRRRARRLRPPGAGHRRQRDAAAGQGPGARRRPAARPGGRVPHPRRLPADARRAGPARRAVVLGGGLLGLEAARALGAAGWQRGAPRGRAPDGSQLDPDAGRCWPATCAGSAPPSTPALGWSGWPTPVRRDVGVARSPDDGATVDGADLVVLACGGPARDRAGPRRRAAAWNAASWSTTGCARSTTTGCSPSATAPSTTARYRPGRPGLGAGPLVAADLTGREALRYTGRAASPGSRRPASTWPRSAIPSGRPAEVVQVQPTRPRARYAKLVIRDDRLVGAILLGDRRGWAITQLFDRGGVLARPTGGRCWAGPSGRSPRRQCPTTPRSARATTCRRGRSAPACESAPGARCAAATRATTGCGGCARPCASLAGSSHDVGRCRHSTRWTLMEEPCMRRWPEEPCRKPGVAGNGMVGHALRRRPLVERGSPRPATITVLGEEPRPAYDRVGLTSFCAVRRRRARLLPSAPDGVRAAARHRGHAVDRGARRVRRRPTARCLRRAGAGHRVAARSCRRCRARTWPAASSTGRSTTWTAIRGGHRRGPPTGAVVGGGLLGLEAANALRGLGLSTHVVEFAPRLMPLQVDEAGGAMLRRHVEELGLTVHTGRGDAR